MGIHAYCLRRYTNIHEYTCNFSKIIHETFMAIHANSCSAAGE
jgi:hypothetical protein